MVEQYPFEYRRLDANLQEKAKVLNPAEVELIELPDPEGKTGGYRDSQYKECFDAYVKGMGGITLNTASDQTYVSGKLYPDPELDEHIFADLRVRGVDIPIGLLRAFLAKEKALNKFHPGWDYLKTLKWDGEPRFDRFVDCFPTNEEDTPSDLKRAFLYNFWLGWPNRVRVGETGIQVSHDYMLVLVGAQHTHKSTALKVMGCGFTQELTAMPERVRDLIGQKGSNCMVDISEFTGMDAKVDKVKGMISSEVDIDRKVFKREEFHIPRSYVFVSTSNRINFLKDTTGNRRFHIINVGDKPIDTIWLDQNMGQIWAEAIHVLEHDYNWQKPLFDMKDENEEYVKRFQYQNETHRELEDMLDGFVDGDWISGKTIRAELRLRGVEAPKNLALPMEGLGIKNGFVSVRQWFTLPDGTKIRPHVFKLKYGEIDTLRSEFMIRNNTPSSTAHRNGGVKPTYADLARA